jgi:hypothetical protein
MSALIQENVRSSESDSNKMMQYMDCIVVQHGPRSARCIAASDIHPASGGDTVVSTPVFDAI